MSNRFLKFLEEIASTDWEYGDGTPMVGDARKHLDEFYRIAELEQQLAEAHEELALSIKERIELGGKLSRYQGGVEVEGRVCMQEYGASIPGLSTILLRYPSDVRVLVMPLESEV